MTSRRHSIFVALVLSTIAFAAPKWLGAADAPYVIIALEPLTGPAAFQGKVQQQALEMFAAYINRTGGIRGRQLKFEVEDTQSNPQLSVQFMNDAVAKRVAVVIGPAFSSECAAILAIVKNGPVDYCTSPGAHPEPGSYEFSAGFSTLDLIAMSVRNLHDRGLKRVALITSTDTSGQDGERGVDAALALPANKDLTLVAREHFGLTDLNVTAQVARIKAANPQAIIAWTTGSSFGTVLRNLYEAGLDVPVVTTLGNQTYEQMQAYAQFLPRELLFATGPFSTPELLTDKAERDAVEAQAVALQMTKLRPGFPAQAPWDPALIVISALRGIGPDATAAQIREYIASQRAFVGAMGRYDFIATPQRGLTASNAVLAKWDAAKGTWVAASKLGGAPLR